jgi:hypothetical protein
MAAASADPQVQPYTAALQTFLAAERARRDVADATDVAAAFCHLDLQSLERDSTALNHVLALSICLSMIFSENRFPLFRIML